MAPDAVHEGAGEERVVRATHPVEQRLARVLRPSRWGSRGRRAPWRASGLLVSGSGSGVPLAGRANVHFTDRSNLLLLVAVLLALGVFLVEDLLGLRRDAELDRGEDVGVGAVIGLGPAVEGVLVALGALDADAEEGGGGLLAPLFGRHSLLPPPEQVESWLVGVGVRPALVGVGLQFRVLLDVFLRRLAVAAGGAEDAVDDLVVGHVVGEAFVEPVVPHLAELGPALLRILQEVGVVAGDVAELGGPQGGVPRMGEEFVDLARPLVGPGVGEELPNLLAASAASRWCRWTRGAGTRCRWTGPTARC